MKCIYLLFETENAGGAGVGEEKEGKELFEF